MTNMALGQNDKEMLLAYSRQLVNRRKQMAVLDISPAEIHQLYMPKYFYDTLVQLSLRDSETDAFYNKDNVVTIRYNNFFTGDDSALADKRHLRIHINTGRNRNIIVPDRTSQWGRGDDGTPLRLWSPHLKEFRRWCTAAVKIEIENQITIRTVEKVVGAATTYKQLFKALPESMKAVASHAELKTGDWSYSRQRVKLKEVLKENERDGAGRARTLPYEIVELLKRRKNTVEEILAMSMLLPNHDGQGKDLPLDNSWPTSFYIDMTKL